MCYQIYVYQGLYINTKSKTEKNSFLNIFQMLFWKGFYS